jgi:leucyl aminopeptidase
MIDLATLTGACAIALGGATGIMTTNKELQDALHEASDATGELAWPLPLFDDFKSQLKSDFADLKNLGDRYGGALTAGLFLSEFVSEDLPWAHMDIAGSGWSAKDGAYTPKGGSGVGVRTLSHWLRGL